MATLTYARETPSQVADWLRARAVADLARLDLELGSNRYLLGSEVTIVDIACCAYLFWPEQAGLPFTDWPNVTRWLDRIRRLPGRAEPYDLLRKVASVRRLEPKEGATCMSCCLRP
jgi:glutathione S-transferase